MPSPRDFAGESHTKYALLRFDFVIIELDLALTFFQIANSTSDPISADRNWENARRARYSARKALGKAVLSSWQRGEVDARLSRLEGLSEAADFA